MNTQQSGEALILKSYDLLKFTIPTIEQIPRKHKFTFGDRLYHLLSDLMERMIEAHYSARSEKLATLRRVNILLTKIRYFFRLGHDLGFYSAGHLGLLAEQVDDIGRRVGRWIKAVS